MGPRFRGGDSREAADDNTGAWQSFAQAQWLPAGYRLLPSRRYRTAACTDAAVCPNRMARSSAVRMPPALGLISLALA